MKLASVIVLAVALLAGCAASPTAAPSPPPDMHGDFVLPSDTYAFTLPEIGRIDLAKQLLIGKCMQRLGYRFDAAAARRDIAAGNHNTVTDLGWYGNPRRYGVTDPAVAARYGYHLETPSLGGGTAAPGLGTVTGAMRRSLTGSCAPEATTALSPDGVVAESDVVADVSARSFRESMHDPAVLAAFGQWARCMGAKGYRYSAPAEACAEFDVDSPRIPAAEIAAAEADVACKQQTHLIDGWHGFEVRYQNDRIAAQRTAFDQAMKDHDAQMRRVDQVI
jgi:hypothetical protein